MVMVFQMKRKNASSIYQSFFAALGLTVPGPRICLSFVLLFGMFLMVRNVANAQVPQLEKDDLSFSYVLAKRGCTQEDAPALEIYFNQNPYTGVGDATPPYIHFEISSSPSETIKSLSFELGPMRRDLKKQGRIIRAEFVESIHSSVWLTGVIVLDEAVPGGHISGHYNVATPKGQHFKNIFRTEYTVHTAVCG